MEFTSISKRAMAATGNISSGAKDEYSQTKKDVIDVTDGTFFNTAMFVFNNNPYTNAFFVNEVVDREYSDLVASYNIKYDLDKSCITLDSPVMDGTYLSTKLCTDTSYRSELNDFFIVVDEDVPAGCDILYYIVTDRDKIYPVKPNSSSPMHIEFKPERPIYFRLKAILKTNGTEYPKINAFAILYHDKFIEESYGLINPDLSNEIKLETSDDMITLVRDPLQEDRLVKVISSEDVVNLTYDPEYENRLSKVQTISSHGDNKKLEEDTLLYGDYVNSEGVTEEVLQRIMVKKNFPEDAPTE